MSFGFMLLFKKELLCSRNDRLTIICRTINRTYFIFCIISPFALSFFLLNFGLNYLKIHSIKYNNNDDPSLVLKLLQLLLLMLIMLLLCCCCCFCCFFCSCSCCSCSCSCCYCCCCCCRRRRLRFLLFERLGSLILLRLLTKTSKSKTPLKVVIKLLVRANFMMDSRIANE
jgi:hypothetical protein